LSEQAELLLVLVQLPALQASTVQATPSEQRFVLSFTNWQPVAGLQESSVQG